MNGIKRQIWPNTSPCEPSKVPFSLCADRHAVLPALSPLPISLMFFSHNKSGPDFLKQTMLWGLSPPITLCQFQSGLKYDSTVCASPCSKSPPSTPISSLLPLLPLLSFPWALQSPWTSLVTQSNSLSPDTILASKKGSWITEDEVSRHPQKLQSCVCWTAQSKTVSIRYAAKLASNLSGIIDNHTLFDVTHKFLKNRCEAQWGGSGGRHLGSAQLHLTLGQSKRSHISRI